MKCLRGAISTAQRIAIRTALTGLVGATLSTPMAAWSFPEMVRHGYANCIACHVSPSGGGVLTDYGRSLSKELLSHWAREGEENPLYVIHQPEWLKLGGDYRSINTYLNNSSERDAKYFTMQSDLEAAVNVGRFDFVATAGTQGGPSGTPKEGQFLSRRHYATLHVKDNVTARIGRFLPKYGLNDANHTIVTQRDIWRDEGSETYNTEVAYLGDKYDLFITAMAGRPDDPTIDGEKGVVISTSYFLRDRHKIGASAMHGTTLAVNRDLVGSYYIISLSKDIYWKGEVDYQWLRGNTSDIPSETKGFVSYQQFNYEFLQGFHVYLVHQLSYLDIGSVQSRTDSYGTGVQLYPRPHFEFAGEIRRERALASADVYYDTGWVLFHYYL